MADYILRQPLKVEALGAVFRFHPPDRALARFFTMTANLQAQKQAAGESLADTISTEDMPPDMFDALIDLFLEGVHGWSGVVGEDGQPVSCNRENKLLFPTDDKLTVAGAFIEAWGEVQGNASQPAPAPTPALPSE